MHSPHLLRPLVLLFVVLCIALLEGGGAKAQPAASDLEAARAGYVEALRDKITAQALDGLDVDAARAAIVRLAAIEDPKVLEILTLDLKHVAERIVDITLKAEEKRIAVERQTRNVKTAQGDARKDAEQALKDAEAELKTARELLPKIRAVHEALTDGLLTAVEKVGVAHADQVFDALVAALREDRQQAADLDDRVRDQEVELKTIRERLPAATEKERDDLERKGADLAARVDAGRAILQQVEKLRARRVATLALAYAKLDKPRQQKELSQVRANLKDDVDASLRAFHVELIGHLPVPESWSLCLSTLKKAADAHQDVEKELEPLREQYNRALKAVNTSLQGGGVTNAVANSEAAARKKLQAASRKGTGELRVVAAAARGLGAVLARMPPEERKKPALELFVLARTNSDRPVRSAAVAAFGAVKDDAIAGEVRGLAEKDPEVNTRLAALDALALMGDEAAVDLCIQTLLRDPEWRVRAAAMRLLVEVPRKRAVPALIESVGNEVGRLIDDADSALAALTGKSFHGSVDLWKEWWAKNEATFDIAKAKETPEEGEPKAGAEATGGKDWREGAKHVSFYGITTRSSRILFIIDRSGSMLDPATDSLTGSNSQKNKMEVAKAELITSLAGLTDDDSFNIVSYSNDIERWVKTMQKATSETRKKATSYVEKDVVALGGTNIYDALREGFLIAGVGSNEKNLASPVDTIFFLTDGEPTVGEATDPEEILHRVRDWNRLAKIVVHAVGVGKDHDGVFLRRLAEENGGQYVAR